MEPRKPKSPLKDKASSNYFYLLTTVDQVVLKDGSRLNVTLGPMKMELLLLEK